MAIGCMSGLLHLFSRQHFRRRIPSAAMKESNATVQTTPTQSELTEVKTKRTLTSGDAKISGADRDFVLQRLTPPLEIRRSGCCLDHVDSPRRSSTLLARLMGLEEPAPPPSREAVGLSVDSTEEKRRTLLGALERCDEDLRALKLIIDAIRTVEMRRLKDAGEPSRNDINKCLDSNGEQPSPVSVLDALWSPKSRSSENAASTALVARPLVPVFSEVEQKKSWSTVMVDCSLKRRMTTKGIPRLPGIRIHAVGESVEELREEAMFEDWEGATVIAELADVVAVDLVNSLVMELAECCLKFSPPSGGCKRKLYL